MNKKNIAGKISSIALITSITFSIGVQAVFAGSTSSVLIPQNFRFNNTLSVGQYKDPDVKYLKAFLNVDGRTALSTIDPCISSDPNTDISSSFDTRTKDALIRFQNLYRGEILTPAGLTTATGVFGLYSRNKVNELLQTSAYTGIRSGASANVVSNNADTVSNYYNTVINSLLASTSRVTVASTTTSNPIVDSYLSAVNRSIVSGYSVLATTTASSTNGGANSGTNGNTNNSGNSSSPASNAVSGQLPASNNPVVNQYYNYLNQLLGSNSLTSANASTSANTASTTGVISTSTAGTIINSTSLSNSNNAVVSNYLNYINQTLNNAGSGTGQNNNTSNPVVNNYLNTVNQVVSNTPAPYSATSTATGTLPVLLAVSPTVVSNCGDTITIVGQHFATTSNIVYGTLGALVATTTRGTSTGSELGVDSVTFSLKQFSNYYGFQAENAGTVQNIAMRISSDNKTSAQTAVVQYAFPGQRVTRNIPQAPEAAVPEPGITEGGASGSSGKNSSGGANKAAGTGILNSIETKDREVYGYSPQGQLLKLIGGDKAADFGYSISPSGHLLQKMQGKQFGLESIKNGGTSKGGSSSNSSSGILGGVLGGVAGAAAGAAVSTVIGNFGGSLTTNFYCNCSYNNLLVIKDVRGWTPQLMYQPGASILYLNYNLTPGVNVLGNYVSGGQCWVYSGYTCVTYGSPTGTILQIGTSITGGK